MEMSYIDMLQKLKKDIESDSIPDKEKANILNLISDLEFRLWKYSY